LAELQGAAGVPVDHAVEDGLAVGGDEVAAPVGELAQCRHRRLGRGPADRLVEVADLARRGRVGRQHREEAVVQLGRPGVFLRAERPQRDLPIGEGQVGDGDVEGVHGGARNQTGHDHVGESPPDTRRCQQVTRR
jgi:hypothetical protein